MASSQNDPELKGSSKTIVAAVQPAKGLIPPPSPEGFKYSRGPFDCSQALVVLVRQLFEIFLLNSVILSANGGFMDLNRVA